MRVFLIVLLSLGHLVTDLTQGALPVLLPALKAEFHLSYGTVALVVLVSNISSSFLQPLFGVWSDRRPGRWLLPAGCVLAALGLALAGCTPLYHLVLLGVFLSGLGTAAYHPEGSKQTFLLAGSRPATALACYSVGGNLGFGLGPLAGAWLLERAGRAGVAGFLLPCGLVAFSISLFLPVLARLAAQKETEGGARSGEVSSSGGAAWAYLLVLLLVVTLRSWVHVGVTTFIPLYYTDYLGRDPRFASTLLTVFLLAGACGTLVSGPLADRWGRKAVLAASLGLALPPLFLFPYTSGALCVFLVGWGGFALISSFAITVVYAQELLPGHIGLASGLMLGFAVGLGGVGAYLLGEAADVFGVRAALLLTAVLLVPALACTAPLPGRREARLGERARR